jgi:hypothetical protein
LLGDSCVDPQAVAQQLLEEIPHSWEELASCERQLRKNEARKRKRGAGGAEEPQQQVEQPASSETPEQTREKRDRESTIQLGMMFLLRKLRELVPAVCWHVYDTSASGLAGRQGPIDISFTAAPLKVWCQLLFYSELKSSLTPLSAQQTVLGQVSNRSVDAFQHQPPQRSHIFGMAAGEDAVQLVCMRKHLAPLHTGLEPFAFNASSPGLLLWLRLLLAEKDAHGFVQTQPPTIAVPGVQLSNFELVDWRGVGNEEEWGAGAPSNTDTAASRASSTIRSSQVWKASCKQGSRAAEDVAVKVGPRASIQREVGS